MRQPKIVNDFLRNTDAKLEIQAGFILASMTGNAFFPTPTPPLAEFNTLLQQYAAALVAAENGAIIQRVQKTKAREALELILKRLANYVMLTAGDDRSIMVSSGFTLNKESRSKVAMGEVDNFSVTVGKISGEAVLKLSTVTGATFYLFYYALATEPIVWNHEASKYPTCTLRNLDPLKTYLFRVKARGVDDDTAESAIITKGVL